MGIVTSYGLRWRRRRLLWRALARRGQLRAVEDRTGRIAAGDILCLSTMRNERARLQFFLDYYRRQGVRHFLIVDNGSQDGTGAYLATQEDVSLWQAEAGYRQSRYGMDWLTALARRHGHGHWCLTVDTDEFFVYPFCDSRPMRALTDWLDASGVRSFAAMLIDMYPKGDVGAQAIAEGQNPLEVAPYFDAANYVISRNPRFRNLWIQGGPRARALFADAPEAAPALNKIPLVKWHRRYAYVHSTHMLLPRGLNLTYATDGGEKASGALLHAKFLPSLRDKAEEESGRAQHYAGGREYAAYRASFDAGLNLWTDWSERYINWRQLEILGLMSKGDWA